MGEKREKNQRLSESTLFVCGAQAELSLAASYFSNLGRKACKYTCRNRAVPEPACDLWKVLIRLIPPHERQDVDECSSEKESLHLNRKKENTCNFLCLQPHSPCGLLTTGHMEYRKLTTYSCLCCNGTSIVKHLEILRQQGVSFEMTLLLLSSFLS